MNSVPSSIADRELPAHVVLEVRRLAARRLRRSASRRSTSASRARRPAGPPRRRRPSGSPRARSGIRASRRASANVLCSVVCILPFLPAGPAVERARISYLLVGKESSRARDMRRMCERRAEDRADGGRPHAHPRRGRAPGADARVQRVQLRRRRRGAAASPRRACTTTSPARRAGPGPDRPVRGPVRRGAGRRSTRARPTRRPSSRRTPASTPTCFAGRAHVHVRDARRRIPRRSPNRCAIAVVALLRRQRALARAACSTPAGATGRCGSRARRAEAARMLVGGLEGAMLVARPYGDIRGSRPRPPS